MKEHKKEITLTIVAIVFLAILVFSATYAYFAVGTTNNFGTKTISAQAEGIGSVTLDGSSATLTMSLNNADMAQSNAKAYYASASGKTSSPTEEVIGTASVTPSTDTNYYHCTYTLTISQSYAGTKNLYNIFKGTEQVNSTTYTSSADELVLIVNGEEYDLHTNTLPKDIDGEFYVKVGSPATITAGLKFNNFNDKQQQLLGGSGVNITIQVKNGTLECEAEEEPPSASETLIALSAELNDTSKIEKYSGPVTDECGANSCTTVQQAQNVYIFKSNTVNHAIFEGFCWRIIRTTETGGVKLLYNGLPVTNGNHRECTATGVNTMLTATQINTSVYNIAYSQGGASDKPAYVGYMYNPNTLNGTYKQQLRGDTTYDVNTNDSLFKEKIEYWFSNSNIDESKLEDAVYCNDRSLASNSSVTEEQLESATSGSIRFINFNNKETLECSLITDSFNTKNRKATTNYKVGFMTKPESKLITSTVFNNSGYWWLGSPYTFGQDEATINCISYSMNDGCDAYYTRGIRPVVSTNTGVQITDGDGSTTSPFIFE